MSQTKRMAARGRGLEEGWGGRLKLADANYYI